MSRPVSHVATDQDGMITRAQALASGMSVEAVRYAIRPGGPWQRVLPGIYSTFTGPLHDIHRLRAAMLAGGPRAVVTGSWACRLLGLSYGPDPGGTVDVLIDSRRNRGHVGFVEIIRTTRLPRPTYWIDDTTPFGGRPVDSGTGRGVIHLAPAARAVVDTVGRWRRLPADWWPTCPGTGCPTCRTGPGHRVTALRNVRALLCEAVQRRRVTVAQLITETDAMPHRGSKLARAAVSDIVAGCRSAPECEVRDIVRRSRILPEPRWNAPLPGERGVVPDACWPEARLVLEVDSRSFHGFGDAPQRTELRRARYAALGWRVLPISPARLRSVPVGVLREIEAAYLADRPG